MDVSQAWPAHKTKQAGKAISEGVAVTTTPPGVAKDRLFLV
jgi:hypothetical protein